MLSPVRAVLTASLLCLLSCTDGSTDLLGGRGADAGPADQGMPNSGCDDGIACTEDRMGADGRCEHLPHDFLCTNTNCIRSTCDVSQGCQERTEPNGTICADGLACQPYVCQSGQCGASTAPDGAYCNDGDACTSEDQCVAGQCVGTPQVEGLSVQSRTFLIDSPRKAAFVQDRLLVQIEAGGPRQRWVARAGTDAAPIANLGIFMDGNGQLLEVGPQAWVRLNHNPVTQDLVLEHISGDGGYGLSPAGGVAVAQRPNDAPELVTVANNTLFFCAVDSDAQVRLHALSLDRGGPLGPAVPLLAAGRPEPCQPQANGGSTAAADIWATWSNSRNSPQLTVYRTRVDGTDTLTSFSYAPDGIHRYGLIESVAVDPDATVILAVANPRWAYLFDLGGSGAINTVPLDRPLNTHLLALRNRQVLFQSSSSLLVYDISSIMQPSLRSIDAAMAPPQEGLAQVLAIDAQQVALVDGIGRLRWLQTSDEGPYSQIVQVKGQGLLQDVVALGPEYIAWSERHLLPISQPWLQGGEIADAPLPTDRAPTNGMAIVYNDSGSLMLGAARHDSHDSCVHAPPGHCPQDRSTSGEPVGLYRRAPAGLVTEDLLLAPWGPRTVGITGDSTAWQLEPGVKGGSWIMNTRFNGSAITLSSQDWTNIPPEQVQDTLLDVHPGGFTARLPDGRARLYRTDGGAPMTDIDGVTAPNAVGSAWAAPYWYVVTEGELAGSRRIITYEIDGTRASHRADHALAGYATQVLGQANGVLYTQQGGRLEAWRLRGIDPPMSLGVIETVSPVTRIRASPLGVMAVRADGITVLSASCE